MGDLGVVAGLGLGLELGVMGDYWMRAFVGFWLVNYGLMAGKRSRHMAIDIESMRLHPMAGSRILLSPNNLLHRIKVLVKGINKRPVLQKLPLTHPIYIKRNNNAKLQKRSLDMFQIISVLVLVLGLPGDLRVRGIPVEVVQQSAVDHAIAEILDL